MKSVMLKLNENHLKWMKMSYKQQLIIVSKLVINYKFYKISEIIAKNFLSFL